MKKRNYAVVAMTVCAISLTACSSSAKQLNNRGIEYYNDSDYEKAEEHFSKAIEKDDDNAEYYINLGMTELELLDYEEAEAVFSTAIQYEDDNMEAYKGMGMAYYFAGDYAQAIDAFSTIIKLSGENYNETTLEALQYYASLQTYYADYAGAIDSYTILLSKNYKVAQQYFLRGSIYTQQGMENEAVLDYEEALKDYGDDYEIYYNIYYNFLKAGYTARAESYLKRALEVEGTDNLLKGKTYYIIEDYENAQKFLSRAVDEGQAEAEYYLAMAYEKLGNLEEAQSLYAAYISKYPEDPRAYNQYGMFFLTQGDYETALSYFEQGLEIDSEDGRQELLYNEACCYEYLYEYKTAFSKFEEYLKAYPEDEAARHEFEFLSTR